MWKHEELYLPNKQRTWLGLYPPISPTRHANPDPTEKIYERCGVRYYIKYKKHFIILKPSAARITQSKCRFHWGCCCIFLSPSVCLIIKSRVFASFLIVYHANIEESNIQSLYCLLFSLLQLMHGCFCLTLSTFAITCHLICCQ